MNRVTPQPQHRPIARIERATSVRVPSRAELAAARSQAQVVVQQTVSQVNRVEKELEAPTIHHLDLRSAMENSQQPVAAQRVTFDRMATAPRPIDEPAPQPMVMRPAMATAGTATIPVWGVAADLSKISRKLHDSKIRVQNSSVVKQIKVTTNKIKNHPVVKQIQAKIPASVKGIKARPSDILRYGVVAACLLVAGFLAYDTWQTNQQIQSVFGPEPTAAAAEAPLVAPAVDSGGGNSGAYPDYAVAADMPRVLSIPTIGVSAIVLQVGLTGSNQVNTPTSMWDTGWYNGSAVPGKPGAAFITGHYNVGGGGGAFDNLGALNGGDTVTVELGDGALVNYEVYNRETIPVEQVDMSAIFATTGETGEGLNLMTCAGQFTRNGFSHRTIVYTKRV